MASSVSVLTRFDYGGPQLSRQNQKAHGKNKILHGKTENLTAKTKYLTRQNRKPQKTKTSRQNQKPHGKNKKTSRQNQRPHGKTKYFTAKTKYLTAKANTHGKTRATLFLLWSIWFCRDGSGPPYLTVLYKTKNSVFPQFYSAKSSLTQA